MRRETVTVIYVGVAWRSGGPCHQAMRRHAARFCRCTVAIPRADRDAPYIAKTKKQIHIEEIQPRGFR